MKEELSLQCHYKVVLDTERNSYSFTTSTKARYEVLFTLENELFVGTDLQGQDIYHIILTKLENGSGGRDQEIAKTAYAIVTHFFRNKNRLLTYSCVTGDNRELSRKRMFDSWFNLSSLVGTLIKIDGDIESAEAVYYSSLIYHVDNHIGSETIENTYFEVVEILNSYKQ